ncbi:MAG: T9SS type A sorting domain-containing protein [Bacteroidales bacterium]|nr:T9SS type A sorting domain-containing protein [Bacteroidales bacterium]
MFKINIFLVLSLLISTLGYGQSALSQLKNRGEVCLKMKLDDFQRLESLVAWDISKVSDDSVAFYVDEERFKTVLKSSIDYRVMPVETLISSGAKYDVQYILSSNFSVYPTYEQYDSIMTILANIYPQMMQRQDLGTLPSGRKIIIWKMSKNISQNDPKPHILLTSTMHGNETTGAILMFKLAKYLVDNYGTDSLSTLLLDSNTIWINPFANPDGTYYGGNHTVAQAKRYNANNVDINRNFPDPDDGPHPDGNAYQPETVIFMDFANNNQFTLAANFHGGAEVFNYPWDTWSKLSADDDWWQRIGNQYATNCHIASNNSYFNFLGGVTNGYQWYEVTGGRQDFMNYFHQCREATIELSNTKLLPENQFTTLWNYNKQALLDYISATNQGLRGYITDSATGNPLKAKIEMLNHDKDSSHVYSYMPHGNFYRLLDSGYYQVKVSASGYNSKVVDSVWIDSDSKTWLNVSLSPKVSGMGKEMVLLDNFTIFPNPASDFVIIKPKTLVEKLQVQIYDITGKLVDSQWSNRSDFYMINLKNLESGVYMLQIFSSCNRLEGVSKMLIER